MFCRSPFVTSHAETLDHLSQIGLVEPGLTADEPLQEVAHHLDLPVTSVDAEDLDLEPRLVSLDDLRDLYVREVVDEDADAVLDVGHEVPVDVVVLDAGRLLEKPVHLVGERGDLVGDVTVNLGRLSVEYGHVTAVERDETKRLDAIDDAHLSQPVVAG